MKSPSALIFRSVILHTVHRKLCVTYSVSISADYKTLISEVGIKIIINIVKAQNNIAELAVSVRYINRMNTCAESHKLNKCAVFISDFININIALAVNLKKTVLKPGESAKLKITVLGDNLSRVKGTPRVLMITNDPKKPSVTIRVKAKIKQP